MNDVGSAGGRGFDDAVAHLRASGSVFAEREAELIYASTTSPDVRRRRLASRAAGTPLEYVVGWAEFAGITVSLGPPAFIPRRRAEVLVKVAVELAANRPTTREAGVVADLGCGPGAIAAALATRLDGWDVHASDIDPGALVHARANAARFGFTVHAGDWWDALPAELYGRLDLVVAHLPYVPSAAVPLLPRDFRDAEPLHTVDGGDDGLDPWRRVAAAAGAWLAPDGALITQVTADQQAEACTIARSSRLDTRARIDDDSVVLVARPAAGE